MKRISNILDLPKTDRPIVLAMGCFDGVHIGHQKVISTAVEQAAACGGEAWVFTFNPHPAKVLVPEKAPPLISAPPCRLRKFEKLGLHGVIEIPFDQTYAHTKPETFLSNLWKKMPTLRGIVCGTDWSFGYHAAGHFQTLEKLCAEHRITATAIPPVLCDGEKISSTTIRKAIADGNIPLAEKLLGRPFSLFGTVVAGEKVGRKLGFPTANIDPLNELLPGNGIYAAWTRIQKTEDRGQRTEKESSVIGPPSSALYPSAVFIGPRETFGCQQHVIESHLLDFDGDLYGQAIEVCLVKKIRGATPFPSKEALREQIGKDIAQIREILKNSE
jgi:riboflavin kinase/FMN adenylyltransferase